MTGVWTFVLLLLANVCLSGLLKADELDASKLGIVINLDDPESVELGAFYQAARQIPGRNLIRVHLGEPVNVLPAQQTEVFLKTLSERTPEHIQAYALAWKRPYRAGCMSITSAVSLGFDSAYCASGCKPTRASTYYGSSSRAPFKDYGMRPAMLLAADNPDQARAMIRRGVAADYTRPDGKVLLMSTSDRHRNVRSRGYQQVRQVFSSVLDIRIEKADWPSSPTDVLMYFTGLKHVPYLERLSFQPGAIADHLTSTGGVLSGSDQMNILDWIGAGATASYGAVVEPCNFPQKFPNPGMFISRYLTGDTLIEAYWKSVQMPGQGVFIGEPLANPFKGCVLVYSKKDGRSRLVNRSYRMVMRERAECGYP